MIIDHRITLWKRFHCILATTHNGEAMVEILPEHASLLGHGVLEIVAKQRRQANSEQHQKKPGQALVLVVRVAPLVVTLLPQDQAHVQDGHAHYGGQLTSVLDGVGGGGAQRPTHRHAE